MAKYKVLAPIGGHQQKVWMPNEVATEKDFRTDVADLIRDGFISLIKEGDEEEVKVEDVNPPAEGGDKNPPVDDKVDDDSGNTDDLTDDVTTREIKAQLDYEGIKYPANATKQELFKIYQEK